MKTTLYTRSVKTATKSFLQKEAKEKGIEVGTVLDQMVTEEKRRRKLKNV